MKRLLIVAILTVAGAGSANAYNWNSSSSFNSEAQKQMDRISAGRKGGVLYRSEARMLRREVRSIMNDGNRASLSKESKRINAYKN
jgi:hypothetical protein